VTDAISTSGGFIVDSHLGWRWTAWLTLILASFFGILALILVPETYGPLILQRRAARLRKETRKWDYHATLDENKPTLREIFFKYFLRPCQMLLQEPILVLVTIYVSLIYGILYLFFVAYPIEFRGTRGWTHAGVAALPLLAVMIGLVVGCLIITLHTKYVYARKLKTQGRVPPEDRLILMMFGGVLLPVSTAIAMH
jgi:MFS family permease